MITPLETTMKLLERLMTTLIRFVGWLIEKIGLPDDDEYDDGGQDE